MRFGTLLIAATLGCAVSTPALAHRQWLLPSTTTLAGTGEYVTVDGAVSNDLFYPDHFPLGTDQVEVTAPDGSAGAIENAATGRYRSTFDVRIDKPGTWRIGVARESVMGSFKAGGEEWRVGGRRRPGATGGARMVESPAQIPADATDVQLTEVSSRNYTYVTADAPTRTVFAPTGKGLEFDPVSHPASLVSDEAATFRFLIDGKPAAGVKVTLVPGGKKYRESEDAQELTTAADGTVRVTWPVAGMYWMSASAQDDHPAEPRAQQRRMAFTTTLEVVAP